MMIGTEPVLGERSPVDWFLCKTRVLATAIITGMLLCLACVPAFAHDDDGPPPPPTPEAQAAAGQMTIAVLSLITGVAVYYAVQRHRLVNSGNRPPEWEAKMNRNAIIFAILAAVLVWGISTALSRPPKKRVPTQASINSEVTGWLSGAPTDTPTFPQQALLSGQGVAEGELSTS